MSTENLELGSLVNQPEKCTRFQVNRVRNDSERKYDVGNHHHHHGEGGNTVSVGVSVSTDEGETTDDENGHSVTDRTRLNSESDAKYGKSFR